MSSERKTGKNRAENKKKLAPKLSLRANLKDFDSSAVFVQGELFPDFDPEFDKGYRGTVASSVAGITYRQLDYWARKGLVQPSVTPSRGSGSRRLYSFKDILILAVSKKLLDIGVNLANVAEAIRFMQSRTAGQLSRVTILCDGKQVYECVSDMQVLDLIRGGKAVFGVSVGALRTAVDEELKDKPCVDIREYRTRMYSQMNDELAQRRAKKAG